MSSDPRYGTPAWKRLRRIILERDGGRCQMTGPRCVGYATEADHIEAIADGGDFWNPANLRAACRPCNSAGGAELTNRRRQTEYETRF